MMRAVAAVGLVSLVVSIGYGLLTGDLRSEGSEILGLAWGRVSLADIYTGVFFFGSWIVWREGSIARALPWLALLLVLGNFGVAPYLWRISRSDAPVGQVITRS
jgi:hypothetical protein